MMKRIRQQPACAHSHRTATRHAQRSGAPPACRAKPSRPAQAQESVDDEAAAQEPLELDEFGQYEYDKRLQGSNLLDGGTVFGEYTPTSMVTFSDDPDDICSHEFEALVHAPRAECYRFLESWFNLPHVMDLIDSIAEDGLDKDVALLQLFYKWKATPPLQIVLTMRRVSSEGEGHIFVTEDGMPVLAKVWFEDAEGGATRVHVSVEHAMPNLMREWVGKMAFESHITDILQENLQVYKLLMEGQLTVDGLEAYYAANRRDAYDGPTRDGNTAYLDKLPEGVALAVRNEMPEGREEAIERHVEGLMMMQELVERGLYVEAEEGWARADLTADEVATADEAARFYRRFVEEGENGELTSASEVVREQLAAARAAADANGDGAAPTYDEVADELDGPVEAVLEESPDVTITLPGRKEAREMGPTQRLAFADTLAERIGFQREWEVLKAEYMVSEAEAAAASDAVKAQIERETAAAEAEGLPRADFLLRRADALTERFREVVAEGGARVGLTAPAFAALVAEFDAATREAALSEGLSHDAFVDRLLAGLSHEEEAARQEAEARGVTAEELVKLRAAIRSGADLKARALGMTVAQYEEYAWGLVRESRARRGGASA